MSESPALLPTLAAVLACVLGASAIVATRFAVGETDPLALAFLRYAGASITMLPIAVVTLGRQLRIPRGGRLPVLGLGALQFGLFGWLFAASLQYVPASRGALVMGTMPIVTLALAAFFGRERMTGTKLAGAIVAFGGVAVALGERALATGTEVWKGDMLMAGAVLVASLYNVLSGLYLPRYPALTMVTMQLPVGAAVLFVLLALSSDFTGLWGFSAGGWIAVVHVATLGGAASFYVWIWALERIPPSRVAVTVAFNPIAAAILGALILSEPITWRTLAGLVGVVGGIVLANWPIRRTAVRAASNQPS